jgi:DNA-binding MarR family transcriptional regulator
VTLSKDGDPNPLPDQTPGGVPSRPASSPADGGRDTLVSELVDEMTSWSPRDRMNVFRSWLKGSLSLIHLHVLTVLEADGPLPMSHLAETLDVSVASTTGIIGRMEERGLVERTHGEADRRVVIVRPTEAGIAIFRDMTEQRRQSLTQLFTRLTDEELSALLTGLRAMHAARLAFHVEKAKDGLVAVRIRPAGTDDAAIAAENAAAPSITGEDA